MFHFPTNRLPKCASTRAVTNPMYKCSTDRLSNALRYWLSQTPCQSWPQITRKMLCDTGCYKPYVGISHKSSLKYTKGEAVTNRTFNFPTNRMQNALRHLLLQALNSNFPQIAYELLYDTCCYKAYLRFSHK